MVRLRSAAGLLVGVLLLVGVAGCSTDSELAGSWSDSSTGQRLPDGSDEAQDLLVVTTYAASTTCGRNDTVFMDLAWPIGTPVDLKQADGRIRTYVRNSRGSAMTLEEESAPETVLPSSAKATGIERGGYEIFADSESRSIYLAKADGKAERWGRLRLGEGCPS